MTERAARGQVLVPTGRRETTLVSLPLLQAVHGSKGARKRKHGGVIGPGRGCRLGVCCWPALQVALMRSTRGGGKRPRSLNRGAAPRIGATGAARCGEARCRDPERIRPNGPAVGAFGRELRSKGEELGYVPVQGIRQDLDIRRSIAHTNGGLQCGCLI